MRMVEGMVILPSKESMKVMYLLYGRDPSGSFLVQSVSFFGSVTISGVSAAYFFLNNYFYWFDSNKNEVN